MAIFLSTPLTVSRLPILSPLVFYISASADSLIKPKLRALTLNFSYALVSPLGYGIALITSVRHNPVVLWNSWIQPTSLSGVLRFNQKFCCVLADRPIHILGEVSRRDGCQIDEKYTVERNRDQKESDLPYYVLGYFDEKSKEALLGFTYFHVRPFHCVFLEWWIPILITPTSIDFNSRDWLNPQQPAVIIHNLCNPTLVQ